MLKIRENPFHPFNPCSHKALRSRAKNPVAPPSNQPPRLQLQVLIDRAHRQIFRSGQHRLDAVLA
jgi:hypothetical protein